MSAGARKRNPAKNIAGAGITGSNQYKERPGGGEKPHENGNTGVDCDETYLKGILPKEYLLNKRRDLEKKKKSLLSRLSKKKRRRVAKKLRDVNSQLLVVYGKIKRGKPTDAVNYFSRKNPKIKKKYIPRMEVNAEVAEYLEREKEKGANLYLVSLSPQKLLDAYFEKNEDQNIFDTIIGDAGTFEGGKSEFLEILDCDKYLNDKKDEVSDTKIDLIYVEHGKIMGKLERFAEEIEKRYRPVGSK